MPQSDLDNADALRMRAQSLSRVRLLAATWPLARLAPLSMECSPGKKT